ncbi:TIGR02281 family clan AA aspartic protease [Pikeienuella piscinae]|uniref:TIGR02281 family clan AA aspartic protease n=1 Tax=Pikeienuella piscinae TaxID=2748098 RepID=A0A7L5BUZ4_9RHOB|nr:TIGR02281 family clan AA aspartic protease [Pikeienuella piscinae]QIE55141.1 TIGR02281 family clan AA aspartic protease [Pikeienuella piscinae]
MLFWPLALIALIAIVIAQLSATFPDALRAEGSSEKLIYLALLLVFILAYGFRRREVRLGPMALMGVGWLAAFAALLVAYTYREEARMVFDRVRGEVSPTIAIARDDGEVELRKAWDGHFRAMALVNGARVGMLVDTGASVVLLSYEDAAAAGLDPEHLAFTQPVTTANGRSHVAPVILESVAIGAVGLSSVRAAVAEEGKLKSSLLGMSFLGRLQETSFRGDSLILRN